MFTQEQVDEMIKNEAEKYSKEILDLKSQVKTLEKDKEVLTKALDTKEKDNEKILNELNTLKADKDFTEAVEEVTAKFGEVPAYVIKLAKLQKFDTKEDIVKHLENEYKEFEQEFTALAEKKGLAKLPEDTAKTTNTTIPTGTTTNKTSSGLSFTWE